MSRSSQPHGYLPFSSFPSPLPINSSTIPPSSNHSSDKSETGSPSGAGPYVYPPARHGVQSLDDPPFISRRANRTQVQFGGTRPDVALPPDTHTYEYDHGDGTPPSAYLHHDRGVYGTSFNQPAHNVFPDDRDRWGASPGSAPDSYYRPTPEQEFQLPSQFPIRSPQPRSGPSSQSPEYGASANALTGLHSGAGAFEPAPGSEEYLRQQLNIPSYQAVNLWALPDPPHGQRPSQPLPVLIKLAIHGSPKRKLTLREIYLALEERFAWYRENRDDKGWKGSIRHNLSLNKVFRNVQRPITEPGKGKYWVLDVTDGEGYKRERKRRTKKTRSGDRDDGDDDDDLSDDEGTGSSSAGSPAPSGGIQDPHSGVRRVRSVPRSTSPYPQPTASTSALSSSPAGDNGGSIASVGATQSYHRTDPPSSHTSFGRVGFNETLYRQPAFGQPSLGLGTRAQYVLPMISQQHVRRPGASRSHTIPNPRAFLHEPGLFGASNSALAPLQSVSAPGMMGGSRVGAVEQQQQQQQQQQHQHQFLGYAGAGGISGYDPSVGVPIQYGQGQYDARMDMGRGSNNSADQGSRTGGRTS